MESREKDSWDVPWHSLSTSAEQAGPGHAVTRTAKVPTVLSYTPPPQTALPCPHVQSSLAFISQCFNKSQVFVNTFFKLFLFSEQSCWKGKGRISIKIAIISFRPGFVPPLPGYWTLSRKTRTYQSKSSEEELGSFCCPQQPNVMIRRRLGQTLLRDAQWLNSDVKTTGNSNYIVGNSFSLWGWPKTGTNYPENLWNFHPWS